MDVAVFHENYLQNQPALSLLTHDPKNTELQAIAIEFCDKGFNRELIQHKDFF